MRKFIIETPYGSTYFIHDDDAIERGDGRNEPSQGWRFAYVARTDGFAFGNHARVDLATLADGKAPTRYKNGSPRYTVADWDHGMRRVWGNTKCHGIASVQWARGFLPGTCAP